MIVGKHTYGAEGITVLHDRQIEDIKPGLHIGNFCSIGSGVTVLVGGNHRSDWATTYPFATPSPEFSEKWQVPPMECHSTNGHVEIGNDVWIGSDVTILSGVTIGNGAIIGTKSVVSRDVPHYGVAVGNPASVTRWRLDVESEEAMERIAWWDWDDDKIREAIPYLCGPIQEFIDKFSA